VTPFFPETVHPERLAFIYARLNNSDSVYSFVFHQEKYTLLSFLSLPVLSPPQCEEKKANTICADKTQCTQENINFHAETHRERSIYKIAERHTARSFHPKPRIWKHTEMRERDNVRSFVGGSADKKRLIYHKVGLTDILLYAYLEQRARARSSPACLRVFWLLLVQYITLQKERERGSGSLIITTAVDCESKQFRGGRLTDRIQVSHFAVSTCQ
jgi:hypothetical protein